MITPDEKMIQFLPNRNKVSSLDAYIKRFNTNFGKIFEIGGLDPFITNLYNMNEEDYNNWYNEARMMNIKFFNEEAKIINLVSKDPNNLELFMEMNQLYKTYKSSINTAYNNFYIKLLTIAPGRPGKVEIVKELIEGQDKAFKNEIAKLFNEGYYYELKEKLIDNKINSLIDSINNNSENMGYEVQKVNEKVLPLIRKLLEYEFVRNNLEFIDHLNSIVDSIPTDLVRELNNIKTKITGHKEKNSDRYIRGRDITNAVNKIQKDQKFKRRYKKR